MEEHKARAVKALQEGLAHFDNYQPVPSDDTPIMAVVDNCDHEFATEDGQLTVGQLRDILSIFTEA